MKPNDCQRLALLQSHHFDERSTTRMTTRGLAFDERIEHAVRQSELAIFDESRERCLAAHRRALERRPSRCVIHPMRLSAERLGGIVLAAQDGADEEYDHRADYGLAGAYERRWQPDLMPDEEAAEGQHIVMVCMDGAAPVGYAGLGILLWRDVQDGVVRLDVVAYHVYVLPARRGQAFGMDLSLACAKVLTQVLRAACNAAPRMWAVHFTLSIGEHSCYEHVFVKQLMHGLQMEADARQRANLGPPVRVDLA